jgi:hypothetical protein
MYRTNATSKADIVDQASESICTFFRDTKRDQGKQQLCRDISKISRGQPHRLQICAIKVTVTLSLKFSWKRQKVRHGAALSGTEKGRDVMLSNVNLSRRSGSLG